MSTRHEIICWYTPVEWAKVRAISADADLMGPTFDEWLQRAETLAKHFESIGATVTKVNINADTLLAFARSAHTYVIDDGVRMAFALSL